MASRLPAPTLDADTRAGLELLARGLAGALEVAGFDELPWGPALAAQLRSVQAPGNQAPVAQATVAQAPIAQATIAQVRDEPAGHDPALSPSTSAVGASVAPTPRTAVASTTTDVAVLSATAPSLAAAPAAAAPPDVAVLDALARVRDPSFDRGARLRILCDEVIGACTRCKLHRGRNKLVFGVGDPRAALVFVGEGPGADEDREGVPFVGAAGRLLTRMIEAMGLTRDAVYICNVVKCRPPNNRDPEPDEVAACEGFLKEQLAVLRPRVIVGLGRHACQTLLRTQTPISKLRGRWHVYDGVDLMPTFHPSYLLREERDPTKARKREAWHDLQLVMDRLGLPRGST